MTRTRLRALAVVAALSVFVSVSHGHPVAVHHRLSEKAIKLSTRLKRVLDDFGLAEKELDVSFKEDFGEPYQDHRAFPFSNPLKVEDCSKTFGKSPAQLIVFGSVMEDFDKQPANHFYEPTSKTDGNPITPYADNAKQRAFEPVAFNPWSYDRALEYYYTALTDFSPLARERAWGDTFYALGHVMHLVQDMSQPSHVRGDPHMGHASGTGVAMLEVWGGHHACSDYDTVAAMLNGTMPAIPSFAHASDYLTELALWSAANFFSDDTIGGRSYLDPIPYQPPCTLSHACSYPPPWSVVDSPCAGGDEPNADWWGIENAFVPLMAVGIRMAAMGWFTSWFFDPQDFTVDEARLFGTLNDPCVLRDNAAVLYPMGAAYSAGLLDHFFRGKLTLTGTAEPEGEQHRLHLTLKNDGADAIDDLSKLVWKWERTDEVYNDLDVTLEFTGKLAPGATVKGEALYPDSDTHAPKDAAKIVVAYRGMLGAEDGVAGARGDVPLVVGTTYTVTVLNGTGSGSYPLCNLARIIAAPASSEQVFGGWVGYDGDAARSACCALPNRRQKVLQYLQRNDFCDIFDCTGGVIGTVDSCCFDPPLYSDCPGTGFSLRLPITEVVAPWDVTVTATYKECQHGVSYEVIAKATEFPDDQPCSFFGCPDYSGCHEFPACRFYYVDSTQTIRRGGPFFVLWTTAPNDRVSVYSRSSEENVWKSSGGNAGNELLTGGYVFDMGDDETGWAFVEEGGDVYCITTHDARACCKEGTCECGTGHRWWGGVTFLNAACGDWEEEYLPPCAIVLRR